MVQNARMKLRQTLGRLAFLLLFLAGSTFAQQLPSAIISDPAPDKDNPAGVEAPDIQSHGSRLNAVFFLASGTGPHPTVLLLHGFPGNEKNQDLAYTLRRAGWNVLFPNYRGSWGSSGSFSFANALEDAQSAVDFLRDPGNVKKYRIDPKRIVLIGHSMGGFMAAYTAAHDPGVFALCMMAAWNIGPTILRSADNGRADSYKNSSPRLAGTTPEGLMAETKANAVKWNYVDYAELLKTRPVLVLEPKDRNRDDSHAMVEALRKAGNLQVVEKYIETDHSFSDHRIALQVAILEWLQSVGDLPSK
jgi:dipeptidyl aminopeptidase/acylaminoacyl peptidase